MNWKALIYTFCLFLLCAPNFLYKITNKVTLNHILLYGVVFSTILYFTYDLVNSEKEYMKTEIDFQIEGSDKLTETLGHLFGYNNTPKISLNNNYGEIITLEDNKIETNTPAPFGPIGPIDNVDVKILSSNPSDEVIQKANDSYESSYRKMMEPPTEPAIPKEEGCMANFNDVKPCCDQPGETVSINRICSKSKPICVNYIAEDEQWGQCISTGGGIGNNVVVLGDYNMKPWKLNDDWKDQGAKWLWFTKNAQLVSSPNSCAIFQYIYYANEPLEIDLHIACGQHCYLIIENSRLFTTTKVEQPPSVYQKGNVHKLLLEEGANKFYFYCYNTGFENSPCGLIVSCLYNNSEKILFHSDSTWTWFQGSPLMDSVIFNKSLTYEPVIALWNKKYKGFLKMNSDGTMGLMHSSNKKLSNNLESRGTIFIYQKQGINNKIGNNTISLYSCGHKKYVSMNESNKMVGRENSDQTVHNNSETWLPTKVTSTTCAFYNVEYFPEKYYLGINDNAIIGTKEIDSSSQWEIIYLDIIRVGRNRVINNVPSFVEHVYNCPLGSQIYLNDTFMTTLNNDYLYNNIYKQLRIKRTDSSYYSPWSQMLLLPGINKMYYEKKNPEFQEVMKQSNINIKQFIVYKNTYFACSKKGELCISNGYTWIVLPNYSITTYGTTGGIGGNMVIGTMENKDVLFCVGPLITISNKNMKYGAIYYRPLEDISNKNTEWKLYSSQTDGSPMTMFQNITYCKKNKKLYSVVDDEFCELNHNGDYMTIKKNSNAKNIRSFEIISLDYKGTMVIGINNDFHIYKEILNTETSGLGPYEMLSNNTEVTKILVLNNIIFALHKSDGKIYYVPLYGGILKEYYRKLKGDLVDIFGYNDALYVVDNQSNILKTDIIFE